MKVEGTWEHTIRRMKSKMTEREIIESIGHDRNFFIDNGMDYNNPDWREIREYIKSLPPEYNRGRYLH